MSVLAYLDKFEQIKGFHLCNWESNNLEVLTPSDVEYERVEMPDERIGYTTNVMYRINRLTSEGRKRLYDKYCNPSLSGLIIYAGLGTGKNHFHRHMSFNHPEFGVINTNMMTLYLLSELVTPDQLVWSDEALEQLCCIAKLGAIFVTGAYSDLMAAKADLFVVHHNHKITENYLRAKAGAFGVRFPDPDENAEWRYTPHGTSMLGACTSGFLVILEPQQYLADFAEMVILNVTNAYDVQTTVTIKPVEWIEYCKSVEPN